MKKHFHEKDNDYKPVLPKLESMMNAESSTEALDNNKRSINFAENQLLNNLDLSKYLKRNGINQEELLSFFKAALAKNMKLKSNIKTTRF